MQSVKEKLFHLEATPPADAWEKIVGKLDEIEGKVTALEKPHRRSVWMFYGMTAAAAVTILILSGIFFNKHKDPQVTKANLFVTTQTRDSIQQNQHMLESIINSPDPEKFIATQGISGHYITISGPEGTPVKISPKLATLIVSANEGHPPKPVWSKTIDKWQHLMLTSTLSPSSVNLMDIVKLASSNIE